MSEKLFKKYPRGAPPAPQLLEAPSSARGPYSTTISYKMIPDGATGQRTPCTSCAITKGRVFCPTCDGSGNYISNDIVVPCTGCNGTGMIPCSACDGIGIAIT